MRLKRGGFVLPMLAAFFLLAGCTAGGTVDNMAEYAEKTVVQELPRELHLLARQVLIDIPVGKVTFSSVEDPNVSAVFRVQAGYEALLEKITMHWELTGQKIQAMLAVPEGFRLDQVAVELTINYPASELPTQTKIRVGTGEVNLSGFRGELDLAVTDGSCTIQEAILEGNSRVVAGGGVTADLRELRPGVHRLEAGFGLLEVGLPAQAGVHIVAQAPMGEIFSDLQFSYLEPGDTSAFGAALSGWLNAGGSELRLLIKSGDISLFPRY